MTPERLPELLDRASNSAPYVDPSAIANTARRAATANRRRRMILVPVLAAVGSAVVFAGASSRLRDAGGARLEPVAPVAPSASDHAIAVTVGKAADSPATATQYTCCRQADIDQVVHPGGVLALHLWAVRDPSAPSTGGSAVLTASIKGPYTDVNGLKSDGGKNDPSVGLPVYESAPVVVTDESPDEVVLLIHVPLTARPGLYNLREETTDTVGGGSSGGSSIVRITP